MATATINISLPDTLKNEVEEIISKDGYGNVSEFFRELVRNHIKERQQRKLETLLAEALKSGEATLFTKADFEGIKERGLKRIKEKKSRSQEKL